MKGTYTELISDLGVGFELPIVRATPVAADKTPVLVLYRVLP